VCDNHKRQFGSCQRVGCGDCDYEYEYEYAGRRNGERAEDRGQRAERMGCKRWGIGIGGKPATGKSAAAAVKTFSSIR